jgi:hypothetical protein
MNTLDPNITTELHRYICITNFYYYLRRQAVPVDWIAFPEVNDKSYDISVMTPDFGEAKFTIAKVVTAVPENIKQLYNHKQLIDVELVTDRSLGTKGWFHSTKADFLILFKNEEEFTMLKMEDLKNDWFINHNLWYPVITDTTVHYITDLVRIKHTERSL